MDSFLESSEEEDNHSEDDTNTVNDDGMESYDELPSEEENKDNNNNELESESESEPDTNYKFTLDDIDWNKVSSSMGDNVEIIESSDKNTPPLLLKKLRRVCNTSLLTQKLNELQTKTKHLPWFESLTVSTRNKTATNLDPKKLKNNDIKREIFFYQNTLNAVKTAITRIKTEVPFGERLVERPNDFYAEMIKSDDHMKKIKGRILWEQKKIGIVENRKKNKRLKKYHKQLMSQKIKENALKIRAEKEALEEWKVSTNRDDRTLQEIMKDARSNYVMKMKNKGKKKPNMKRIIKNLKYGSGYVQKGIKGKNKNRNTFSSTNNYQQDWKQSKMAERNDKNRGFARGSKRFNSKYKNVKRERRILGKNRKKGSGKRPGKSVRKKMYRNNNM